ncbi:MAG TPA: ABC transporter permease [Gemmatimonadaceae bacterium]
MHEMVIEAGHAERNYWRDLWRYRELFWFLAWRDILVRYKQTALGIGWALLQPLLTMIVLTVVFGKVAKLPSNGVPYPVLVLAGLLPWQFFSRALAESSMSLITNTNLISKVYFPRLIVPAGSVVVSLVDFLISFALLVVLMVWYQFWPGMRLLALVPLVPLAVLAATGPGLLISALNVRYRDFRYIVPFIVQLGVYISPVGFSSDLIPDKWRMLYSLNPLVGIIDLFRWSVTGSALYVPSVIISAAVILFLLALGVWYFRRTEKTFADII